MCVCVCKGVSALACSQQDDLIVQGQFRKVWDPLGPFHQGKELLVCCLADVSDWIIGLWRDTSTSDLHAHGDAGDLGCVLHLY